MKLQYSLRSLALLAALGTPITYAYGQVETAQVAGTVTDATGAIVPNATVVIRNADTGFQRTVVSNGEGLYSAV